MVYLFSFLFPFFVFSYLLCEDALSPTTVACEASWNLKLWAQKGVVRNLEGTRVKSSSLISEK